MNHVGVHGGGATLLWTPGDEWQIERTGIAQLIGAQDGQYPERGLPPVARARASRSPSKTIISWEL